MALVQTRAFFLKQPVSYEVDDACEFVQYCHENRCETWCSNSSKPAAKTIDLCNNPMTKEPKLEQARRIVGEWEDLDATVRSLEDKCTADES